MKTVSTTSAFHKAMIAILVAVDVDLYLGESNEKDYFNHIKNAEYSDSNKIALAFWNTIQGDSQSSYRPEIQEEREVKYKRLLSEINYDWAKELFHGEDILLENGVSLPFYYMSIFQEYSFSCLYDGLFEGEEVFSGEKIDNTTLVQIGITPKWYVTLENRKFINLRRNDYKRHYRQYLYAISYEHFSSGYVDPGETIDVFAENVETAMELMSERYNSPEDGIYHSFEICHSTDPALSTEENPSLDLTFGNSSLSYEARVEFQ